MKKFNRIIILLAFFFVISLVNLYSVYATETKANMKVNNITTEIPDNEFLISNENELGIVADAVVYSKPSSIYEFFDENNAYNLVYATEDNVYWTSFDISMTESQTLSTKVLYNKDNVDKILKDITFTVGGYSYYKENLYIVYARAVEDLEDNALALVKYDKNFQEVSRIEIKAKDVNSSAYYQKSGMKFPFYGANCSIAINPETEVLSVLLGKNRFDGNQDSSILFFDIDEMRWISDKSDTSQKSDVPYRLASTHSVKHSLGQRVIPTSDGGFLLAESGDSYKTRGLNITQILPKRKEPAIRKIMFNYREGKNSLWGNNSTYQALGNIIELSDGYIYIGASEKTLDVNYGNIINESWNLFAQKYKKENFENKSVESLQMFDEPLRKASVANPIPMIGNLFLKGTEVDYGVKWLTDLKNASSVVFVRAIKIEDDNVVIIWQEAGMKETGDEDGGYNYNESTLSAYYMVIDKDGKIKTEKTLIEYAGKLSVEEQYVYNDKKIYWATASGKSKDIVVHMLDVENPYTHTFKDVKQKEWYSEGIQYVYNRGIMTGDETFGINEKFTRGMMVAALYSIEGKPEVSGNSKFSDVRDPNSYYYKAVKWATTEGIVNGYKDGTFSPDDNVTKEDLVVALYKYAKYKDKDVSKIRNIGEYADSWKTQKYAMEAMKWAVTNGIVKGSKEKLLEPQANPTRAEVASILMNYCKKMEF